MTAYANGNLAQDPERSILLSMHAVNATWGFREPPLPVAEDVLHQAILSSNVQLTLLGHSGPVHHVGFSTDGKCLVSVGEDGTKVWDAVSGQELLSLQGYSSMAISPDGKRLATASDTVQVYTLDLRYCST